MSSSAGSGVTDVSIRKALPGSQEGLLQHPEHCSADPGTLAAVGCVAGQQVRITRNCDEYGLYTVSEVGQENEVGVLRMGVTGRRRLGTSGAFEGAVDARVAHPTLPEDAAEADGEFIERLDDDGSRAGLIAIAPHGGDIERYTDQQAERVAERLAPRAVSSWRCKGWRPGGGASDRWHITSTEINEASFPLLGSVISRGFTHAVAFHGFARPEILIGGSAPAALKQQMRAAIQGATAGSGLEVRVAGPADGLGGTDPRNIVNRLSAGGASGIQLEQSLQARSSHWRAIADAVADVYDAALPT
jgi:phage replication-related protein YjqB (UPF0714/DUF867 family)